MAGGNKRIIFNTRERVISPDANRAQRFTEYDRAEIARRLMSNPIPGFFSNEGKQELGSFFNTLTADAAPVGTPLRGDVLEGLVVMPVVGTLNLLVSPGAVWLDDPDGQAGSSDPSPPNPDDSRNKLVVDPGIVSIGVLLAGVGGGGGIRIDVIEVQRTATVLEVDNRDIFDPSTGTFIPIAVNKVEEGRLVYRRRAGVAGAGFPANVQGWLPICIIAVPNAAVNVDTMTFWDVRPYVKDRVNAPFETSFVTTAQENNIITGNIFTNPAQTRLTGFALNRFDDYLVGGKLIVGNTGWVDAQDVANQASGFAPAAFALYYLYALVPFGLPRWVRYQDFPSARLPIGPRGILTVSDVPPGNDFFASSIVPLPLATGLGGSSLGTMLAVGSTSGASVPQPITVTGGLNMNTLAAPTPPAAVPFGTSDRYTLVAGTHFPLTTRWVLLTFFTTFSGPAAVNFQYSTTVLIFNDAFASFVMPVTGDSRGDFLLVGAGPFTQTVLCSVWVLRPIAGSGNTYGSDNLNVQINWATTAGVTAHAASGIAISGWKLDE